MSEARAPLLRALEKKQGLAAGALDGTTREGCHVILEEAFPPRVFQELRTEMPDEFARPSSIGVSPGRRRWLAGKMDEDEALLKDLNEAEFQDLVQVFAAGR